MGKIRCIGNVLRQLQICYISALFIFITLFIVSVCPIKALEVSDGFNYPIGPRNPGTVTAAPDGDGWFNAQDFGEFNSTQGGLHPGEDWNDERGGPSDVGAPVYAVSHGEVVGLRQVFSSPSTGSLPIGSVLVLRHILPNGQNVYSVYLHINVIAEIQGEIKRDRQIGTIADIRPALLPHLHFEIRTTAPSIANLWPNDLGKGYYASTEELKDDGFTIDPSDFIDAHRPISNSASRSCHTFTFGSPIPNGFGVPWNVFNTSEVLLQASCNFVSIPLPLTVIAQIGPATYVYNQGYAWVNNNWQQVTFSCTGGTLVSNAWCPQSAQGMVPNNSTYYVGYTCNWMGTKWNCGCADTNCSQGFWQLQKIN